MSTKFVISNDLMWNKIKQNFPYQVTTTTPGSDSDQHRHFLRMTL